MKITKNVGRLDAYFRISIGFTLFGYGIAKKCGPFIIFGAGQVASGITRYCPFYNALGMTSVDEELSFVTNEIHFKMPQPNE